MRLAYALTFNKAQGQTCDAVLLDLRKPVFSHGFIYVGLSRVRSLASLLILTADEHVQTDAPVVTNIVYPELLFKNTTAATTAPVSADPSISSGGLLAELHASAAIWRDEWHDPDAIERESEQQFRRTRDEGDFSQFRNQKDFSKRPRRNT